MRMFLIYIFSLISCSNLDSVREREKITAPFNGEKFDNLEPFEDKSIFDLLKWRLGSIKNSTSWPEKREITQYKPVKQRSQDLIISVINHSSVLIQVDNLNIITDPHYSERCSPVSFIGPKRVIKPGIAFEDLPQIDIVLVSHNHYDHLDLKTLQKLSERDSPQIYAGLGTAQFLKDNGIENAHDFDWWESKDFKNVVFHFVPSQHWSARGLFDKREMLWGGFVIKARKNIYFAGDTGYGKFFKLIEKKLNKIDLALIPIGAYEPRWFMKNAHMNPEEAVKAFLDLKADKAVGIHFGTFKLTDEGIDTPIYELKEAKRKFKLDSDQFIVPTFGKSYRFH